MCAIIIIRITLITDYTSPRSVIWISVKGDQIDLEGWSIYLKYTLSEGGAHDRSNLIALRKSCHSREHAARGDRWHSR